MALISISRQRVSLCPPATTRWKIANPLKRDRSLSLYDIVDITALLDSAIVLLDSHHHRFNAGERLDIGFREARFAHPATAIGAGVVEAALGFKQHD